MTSGEGVDTTAQRSTLEQQLADAKLRFLYAETPEVRRRWLSETIRIKRALQDLDHAG